MTKTKILESFTERYMFYVYTHTYTNMFLNFKENTTKFRGKLYRLRLLLLTYPSCTVQHFF